MTIKGLSDTRRLPRLGHIRLGIKDTNDQGVEYPKATDYFVVPPEVAEKYGEKPTELKIMFPLPEFPEQWLKCYSKSRGLICKGNGETTGALIDVETGELATAKSEKVEMREIACPHKECPYYIKGQCKEVMTLQFLIPDVSGVGVWQIVTSSINSIININSMLEFVKILVGHIHMIPMDLVLEPYEASVDGRKKTIHVLNLKIDKPLSATPAIKKASIPVLAPAPEEGRPEDLFPDSVVDDIEEEIEKTEKPEEPKSKSKEQKAKKQEPKSKAPKEDKGEEKQEAAKEPVTNEEPPEDLPFDTDEQPGPAFKDDQEGLIKSIHIRAEEIHKDYYENTVRPWIKNNFGVESSKELNEDQLKQTLNEMNRQPNDEEKKWFAEAMRELGYSDSVLLEFMVQVTGKKFQGKGTFNKGDLHKTYLQVKDQSLKEEKSKPEQQGIDQFINNES